MEYISNEEKAKEIMNKFYGNLTPHYTHNEVFDKCFRARYADILEAMEWKDKKFENAIKEIKANIIEARDRKEYYETNRETTLNWILRLIDECCESISIQKENKL